MQEPATPKPRVKSAHDDALFVLTRLRNAGHVAYFAGGCVRDLLLGQQPKDFDVATDAPPSRVQQLFRNTQAVGAAFGVILVRQGGSQIEVATFRAEGGYDDGRHPSKVRFTTAEEDARRRDFTINGLFLDPVSDRVIDYVGGQDDIKARVVRAIGVPAERFDEDSLRLLRAVRFAARLGFAIDPETVDAIKHHAPQLKRISPERIAEELRVMLTPVTRGDGWRRLWELDLIPVIFRFLTPTISPMPGDRPFLFERVAPTELIPFGTALAAGAACVWLRSHAEHSDACTFFATANVNSAVRAMRQALRISNEESELMRGTLSGIEPLLGDAFPSVAQLKRFLAEPTSRSSRALLGAFSSIGKQSDRIEALERELTRLELTEFAPEPLIDGDELTAAGLVPGPVFKKILNQVYDEQLEGRIVTREQALQLALEINSSSRPPAQQ
jgi:tRNA nucleotidyltransferase/poly(A) polymerase